MKSVSNSFSLFVLLLCLFLSSLCYSQEVKIVGHIISSVDSLPIENVNIVVKGTNRGTSSNKEGDFILKSIKLPCVLKLSHIVYLQKEISLTKKDISKNNTIPINIQLNENASTLSEIVIRDKPYYSLERLVYDFEVDDNYLYLICNKKDQKQLQVYTFEDYKERTQTLPKDCNELGYDLHKNLYAKHENNSDYWLISQNDTILKHRDYDSVLVGIQKIIPNPNNSIPNKSDLFFTWYFENNKEETDPNTLSVGGVNYRGTLKHGVYFSYDRGWWGKHKELYLMYEEKGKIKYRMIYYAFYDIDDWLMSTIKPSTYKYKISKAIQLSEYEIEQLRLLKKSGDILNEYLNRLKPRFYINGIPNPSNLFIFYCYQKRALRFPISFVITDKYLFIFNFDKGRLYKLDEDNVLVSTVNVDTLFTKDAFADVILNRESSRCFVRCNNGERVSLKEINLETGEYKQTIDLLEPKVEKIRIVKNYL